MRVADKIEQRAKRATTLEEAAAILAELLSSDLANWIDGRLYRTKQEVPAVSGLKIEVRREGELPHFHLTAPGIDAVFSIADCALLRGTIGGREQSLVEWWFARCHSLLGE